MKQGKGEEGRGVEGTFPVMGKPLLSGIVFTVSTKSNGLRLA